MLSRVVPRIVKSHGLDGASCGVSSPARESRMKLKLKEPSAARVTCPFMSVRVTSLSWIRRERRPTRSASTETRPAYSSVSCSGSATIRFSRTTRVGQDNTRRSSDVSAPDVSFSEATTRWTILFWTAGIRMMGTSRNRSAMSDSHIHQKTRIAIRTIHFTALRFCCMEGSLEMGFSYTRVQSVREISPLSRQFFGYHCQNFVVPRGAVSGIVRRVRAHFIHPATWWDCDCNYV